MKKFRVNVLDTATGNFVPWSHFVNATCFEAEHPATGEIKTFARFETPEDVPFDEFGIFREFGFEVQKIDLENEEA